jgi:hypothetical protein
MWPDVPDVHSMSLKFPYMDEYLRICPLTAMCGFLLFEVISALEVPEIPLYG